MDFFKALRGKTDIRKKYAQMRRLCIAGILLLGFYAISAFPGYYEAGLNLNNCLMMGFVLLSAIVLFYLERAYSSKEGARPHDWNSSGGSMHAFSFVRAFCPGCGARLGLAGQKAGELPVFCAPGKVLSEELKFTCPHCRRQYEEEQVVQEYGASSKLSGARAAEIMKEIKGLHPFRLCAEYTRHYLLITIILLLVQISCIYFARLRPVNLLLPLFVGYFLFVSVINTLTAAATRYYVTEKGVVQRTAWGYYLYGFSPKASLIRFPAEGGGFVWGLLTEAENLLISPIIADWEDMLKELKEKAQNKHVYFYG